MQTRLLPSGTGASGTVGLDVRQPIVIFCGAKLLRAVEFENLMFGVDLAIASLKAVR
jgi:hypothetical protein